MDSKEEIRALQRRIRELETELDRVMRGGAEATPESIDWRERYQALVAQVEMGVVVYEALEGGEDFLIREFNPAASRIEGVEASSALDRRLSEVFPGVERFGLLEVLRRVWTSGEPARHPVARYEDERMAGWRENSVYRLGSGRVVAVYSDLDAKISAERALQDSLERFRAITETALDSIFTKDVERRYTLVNPAMCRLFGCQADHLLGKTPEELFDPTAARTVRETDEATFAGEQVSEIRELQLGGERRVFHTIQVPMREVDGEVVEICGIVRDITARVRAEERVRELAGELERRVEERTAELKFVNAELEAFAYSVSHDLRAPLRAIDGFSRILDEDYGAQLDESGRQLIQRTRAATGRLGRLIDNLLRLARASRKDLEKMPVDLTKLAAKVVGELRNAEPGREVQFLCEGDLEVRGDPMLLRTVLENLLSNAWKFTRREAAPRVCMRARRQEGEVVVEIEDNGVGFDVAHAGRLFGTFQRLHQDEEFEGTGVGLATVSRIALRHGGRAWAEAEPGRGATFFFSLPI